MTERTNKRTENESDYDAISAAWRRACFSSVPGAGRFPALCAAGPLPRKEPPCLLFWPAGILVSAAGFCPRCQNTQERAKVSTQVEGIQN